MKYTLVPQFVEIVIRVANVLMRRFGVLSIRIVVKLTRCISFNIIRGVG